MERHTPVWRLICAILILGTQLFLPITPAFADDTEQSGEGISVQEQAPQEPESTAISETEADAEPALVEESTVSEEESISTEENGANPELKSEEVQTATEGEGDAPNSETSSSTGSFDTVSVPESDTSGGVPLGTSTSSEEGNTDGGNESTTGNSGEDTDVLTISTSTEEVVIEEEVATTTTTDAEVEVIQEVSEIPAVEVPSVGDEVVDAPTTTQSESGEASTTTSTTTEEGPIPIELHTFTSDAAYTFDTDECARVADGSFYCSTGTTNEVRRADRVFSAPDKDGDSEIFVERDGEITQQTFNTEEDASPYYDNASETIVFHKLLGARYQIAELDVVSGEETVLTHDSYNNMQPSRNGDITVWQGWVGNDWEIMVRDGEEIRMLTDNTIHDIGPTLQGEFVMWQSESEDGWKVMLYNTRTGMTESIDEADGASIQNPRLMLVYDATHANGDREVRGYDFAREETVALHSEAPEPPPDIPEPDQTGEERALITSVTQVKSKTGESEDDLDTLPIEPDLDATEATTTDSTTLVIPPLASSTLPILVDELDQASLDENIDETSTTDEATDVVIPSRDEEVTHIPDLIIPDFNDGSGTSTDSQVEVAETL